jgi:hypothetical protein
MERRFTNYDPQGVATVTYRDVTWQEIRHHRDNLLKHSDWRAGKDVVLSTAWKEYRQALRDLGGFDDANSAADSWPVAPDE